MTITHSADVITISGVETGDALRAYINSNGLGRVTDRSTFCDANIQGTSDLEFTDNDCTWVFSGAYHWDFTSVPISFDLEDAVIIYTESAKSHTTVLRGSTVRLKNVQYRIEGGTGRTDFFSSTRTGFELSNVQFISYGGGNFLHLPTEGGLLENVSVFVKSGSLTFQPDCPSGETLFARDWTLDGVTQIIGNGGGSITAVTRFENLTWTATTWIVGVYNRGQYYKFINPNKPTGWSGYQGGSNLSTTRVDEFHTHNVKIVDENNIGVDGFKVQLRRSDNTTIVYDLTTDSNGDIAEQEVLTYEQTGPGIDFTQYNGFLLGGASYNNQIVSGTKNLADGRLDEIIVSFTDSLITESTKSVVEAYAELETSAKFYDRAKAYLSNNYAGETATLITRSDATIDAGDQDIIIDSMAGSTFTFVSGTPNIITIHADTYTGGITTTGTLTIQNGVALNSGTYSDIITADSGVTYTNITTSKINHTGAGTSTLTLDNSTVTEIEVTGGGNLTVNLVNGANVTTSTQTSGTITLINNVDIIAPNLVDGTRVQLYNITKNLELDNSVVSGGSGYSFTINVDDIQISIGDTIRLRATQQNGVIAKLNLEASGIIAATGLSFINTQEDDIIYNTYAIDGSLVTKFSPDYVDTEIDLIVSSNFSAQELYAWAVYNLTTEQGIRLFFGGFTAIDIANIRINTDVVNAYLDNNTASNVYQSDNIRIYRADEAYPVKDPTTGGGGIDIVWRNQIFVAETNVSGLTAQESEQLSNISDVKNNTALIPALL